ncbi:MULTISPECIES: NAD(P)-dependent oxidoreductase [unclassified Sphingobacterium]|uniref:NAD(P)-dependent oxidoreductase n=1 Tax=unclassified Sphingobacterium TaxID=2609468 RepID=UPI00265CEE8D|nr:MULTISPECIES: NAD(P)H-binding protein [unclassified Sphingobacterium]WKK56831.1 NAD(P)H-binding protein [Sphingobacterium sp. BN32]
MKVALIGATGYVGSHILKELVDRNIEVTAIARDVEELKNKDHVLAVQVDVNDEGRLASALKGNDAVISAYNAGWGNPNIYDDFLVGGRNILEAVKDAGIKRLIVVGGAGSLKVENDERLVDTTGFPGEIKPGALAAADYLDLVEREDKLDWTFFSPAIEMNPGNPGKRTGSYRTAIGHPVFNHEGKSTISVEDVAVAIVDELENNQFIKKHFSAGY